MTNEENVQRACATCSHRDLGGCERPCSTCIGWETKPNWVAKRQSIDDATTEDWQRWQREILENSVAAQIRAVPSTGPLPPQSPSERRIDVTHKSTDPRKAVEHPLYEVFMSAIEQAMHGKGQRHGGARTEFTKQPWVHYGKMHGRGFLTGQAAKKLEEAASTRYGAAFETEVFGAMVYLGMAILHERSAAQNEASHGG